MSFAGYPEYKGSGAEWLGQDVKVRMLPEA